MSTLSKARILRNYHHLPPTKFHTFNQRVHKSLAEMEIPEATWAANPSLLSSYFAASDKHDAVYREATYGSSLVIAEREVLQKQLIIYLDEIALVLEAAALRNPNLLLSSGFDLAKERRSSTRAKAAQSAPGVPATEPQGSNQ